MAIIRWFIGRIILFFDFIFSPKAPKRSKEQQSLIDQSVQHFQLYQLPACPFCVKVRRALKRNGLNIDLRNINDDAKYKEELISQGGKRTVPCLRIENDDNSVTWMYESKDIINFLEQHIRAC